MKKNVAFIIPSLCGGGAERVVAILSLNIPKYYNLYIITYENKKLNYDHGGNVINLDIPGSNSKLGKLWATIKRIHKVKKIKKEYAIEKTISFLDNPNIVNVLSRQRDKVILSVRNQKSKEIEGKNAKISRIVTGTLYNKADKVIALSNGVRDDLFNNFDVHKDKLDVIYNPVDINYLSSLKDEEIEDKYKSIFSEENYTIITSGRLSYQKGQWYLLRAFKSVLESIKNVNLVILGEGELESELKDMAENLGISDRVHFLGFQKNPFKYIKRADLFVFPSLFEGFGNVVTESMACGTVVISSDCKSGPKEILNPSNNEMDIENVHFADYGVLVPAFDGKKYNFSDPLTKQEEYLADSIVKLLEDKELREEYEQKLFERVSNFDPEVIVNEWCNL